MGLIVLIVQLASCIITTSCLYVSSNSVDGVISLEDPDFHYTNVSLQCQGQNTNNIFPIGDSVGMYFEDIYPELGYLINTTKADCLWFFRPEHDYNFVELFVRKLEPENCYMSTLSLNFTDVNVSRICSMEKIEGFKFVSKNITAEYIYEKVPKAYYKIELLIRERSPVNEACDFVTTELGYRYHFLFEMSDTGIQDGYEDLPQIGMELFNINYTYSVINRDNLGVTICFQNDIIIPSEDVPSCHSDSEDSCEWEIIDGVEVVREVPDLKGYHWKIRGLATFRTRSKYIQLESICLYIEYLLDPSSEAGLKVYATVAAGKILIVQRQLVSNMWQIARIVSPVPEHLKDQSMQLILHIETKGNVFINKIYGCNPFNMEDRVVLPPQLNGRLYGSVSKHSIRYSGSCRNGGTLVDTACQCAVGFDGPYCEHGNQRCVITCGKNKFGRNCGSDCSLFKKGCKQIIFCDDNVGCSCATGFKGRYCNKVCDRFEYGSGCVLSCGNCMHNETCNKYTGHCKGGCQAGYLPPFCHQKLIHFIRAPIVRDLSFREISVETVLNKTTLAGEGSASHFLVQYMNKKDNDWANHSPIPIPEDGHIAMKLGNLLADTEYQLRIILLNEKAPGYDGDDIPMTIFTTPCRDDLKYVLRVEELRISEATISWQPEIDDDANCEIISNDVYMSIGSAWVKIKVSGLSYTLKDLLPSSTYRIRIRPISRRPGSYSSLSFTTLPQCTGEVKKLRVSTIGSTYVEIDWDVYRENLKSVYSVDYVCGRIMVEPKLPCDSESKEYKSDTNAFNLTGLLPYREYSIKVREVCNESTPVTSGYSVVSVVTKTDIPSAQPKDGKILSLFSKSAVIQWYSPSDCSFCNGFITGYHIEVYDMMMKKLFTGFVKETYLSLDGLLPNKQYNLRVYLVNEHGWNRNIWMEMTFITLLN